MEGTVTVLSWGGGTWTGLGRQAIVQGPRARPPPGARGKNNGKQVERKAERKARERKDPQRLLMCAT